jgi:hypothetical protein
MVRHDSREVHMADLVSMKLPPRKEKVDTTCSPCAMPQEQYPYGLRLHLDTEQLEQLGVDKLPAVGTEVTIIAKATVNNVHESTTDGTGGKHAYRSVGVQITDLALKSSKAEKKSEAVFYEDDEKGS